MGQMKKLATARQMGFATPQVAQRYARAKATEPSPDQSQNAPEAQPGGSEAIQGTLVFGDEDVAWRAPTLGRAAIGRKRH
jgi:hypothetical protein